MKRLPMIVSKNSTFFIHFDPIWYIITHLDLFLIHFKWFWNRFWSILNVWFLGLQGQAEKMLNETKEKVSEYTEAAMEKVNNCKVS